MAIPTDRPVHVRVASVTKSFTAVLVLQLVDEDRFDLDRPIDTYLPGVVLGGGDLTVRRILGHRTGHTYADELRTRLLDPLSLTDTYLPAPGETGLRDPHLTGYETVDGTVVDRTRIEPSLAWAAGRPARSARPRPVRLNVFSGSARGVGSRDWRSRWSRRCRSGRVRRT
ncbi:serine hydrolase [Nocardia takedensis]